MEILVRRVAMKLASLYLCVAAFAAAPVFSQQSPAPAVFDRFGLARFPGGISQSVDAEVASAATAIKWSSDFVYTPDTALSLHSAVYDPATKVMTVFGGIDWGAETTTTNAALLYTPGTPAGTWTTLIANGAAGAPSARAGHSAVYDSSNNRMIVFGGLCSLSQSCTTLFNDVWVLSNANGQGGAPAWTQLSPSGTPPDPRWSQTAVYDAKHNRMIVYGGTSASTVYTDVFVLSHANGLGGTPVWKQLAPGGTPPLGAWLASAVYDPGSNTMTVFGGENSSGTADTNGVWTLSNANGLGGTPQWTNIVADSAAGSPAQRSGHSAVYDAAHDRMIIFGGLAFSGPRSESGFNDVWVLTYANGVGGTPAWTQLKPTGLAPGTRCEHTAVYDAASNQMMIFAGINQDPVYYVVWVLSSANGL